MKILTVHSGRAFPSWTFSHYISATEINYRRLSTIKRIIDLIAEGHADEDFKVALKSVEIFQDREISVDEFEAYVPFLSKSSDYVMFWRLIRRLDRPAVFVRSARGRGYEPVFRPWGPEALRIRNAQLESPFRITFEGIADAINALRFSKDRERRSQERHALDMRQGGLAIQKDEVALMAEKLDLIDKINSANLSEEAKHEITHHVLGIVANQTDKNGSIDAEFIEVGEGVLLPDQDHNGS